jgi:hypothetical protein
MRNTRTSRSGGQVITMMQSTEPWYGDDITVGACFSLRCGPPEFAYTTQGECDLRDTSDQHSSHIIELRQVWYPWHAWYGRRVSVHATLVRRGVAVAHCSSENAYPCRLLELPLWMLDSAVCHKVRPAKPGNVTVESLRELSYLLNLTPGAPAEDAPSFMRNNEKTVENSKRKCRQSEEIHRCNSFAMIVQKCRPLFCRLRIPESFPHPTQNAALGNVVAEHFRLAMYARCSPRLILDDLSVNQFAHFPTHAFSSRTFSIS